MEKVRRGLLGDPCFEDSWGGSWVRPRLIPALEGSLRPGPAGFPFEGAGLGVRAGSAARRRLRLPDPPSGLRAGSNNLRQFQELAQRCEQDADASTSTLESEVRSQASTAVPLESVDAFVHSASELAVETLKLGRTSEAQKIIRMADNFYDDLLSQSSSGSARLSRSGRSGRDFGALSRARPTSALSQLA